VSKRSADETRALLIQTASRLIADSGIGRLTLDEVARRADVSKGGLLYHFPSKDALIEGLVRWLIAHFEAQIAREIAADIDADARGCYTRAYLRASFRTEPGELELYTGFAAALDANPTLMTIVRGVGKDWRDHLLNDGIAPNVAAAAALAADGLLFNDLTGITEADEAERAAVLATLIAWVNGARI